MHTLIIVETVAPIIQVVEAEAVTPIRTQSQQIPGRCWPLILVEEAGNMEVTVEDQV